MTAPVRDYSETLFLPKTDFPMRAGLPQKEPEILARWEKQNLYARLREAARRPALRQWQHPYRARAEQDPQGRGDAQPADARLRFQLRAGLGLSRPAHRMEDRGGELPLQEQEEAGPVEPGSDDRLPPRVPRLCGALAQRAARRIQAAGHRGRLGASLHHDGFRRRSADRARADEVRRQRAALPWLQAGDVVSGGEDGAGGSGGRVRGLHQRYGVGEVSGWGQHWHASASSEKSWWRICRDLDDNALDNPR